MPHDLPPYKQVAQLYEDRIRSGSLRPGDRLPSRSDLVEIHQHSRPTIDKAVERLARKGLVLLDQTEPTRTRRPVVVDISKRHSTVEDRMANLRQTGKVLAENETCEILQAGMVDCPERIAPILGVQVGEEVLLRKRVTSVDGEPVGMSLSYFAPEVAAMTPELGQRKGIKGGARELACERMGSKAATVDNGVVGRRPTTEERETLQLEPDIWINVVTRTVYVEDGRIVEVADKLADARKPLLFETRLG